VAEAYGEKDKAIALEIVRRYGGVTKEAMAEIRRALQTPTLNKTTVYRWAQAAQLQPAVATELQPIKKEAAAAAGQALDDYFEQVARKMLARALQDDVIGDMKGRELVTAAAIAVDKMRLLRDMPTEIIGLWPGLLDAVGALGLNLADVFNALIAQAAEEQIRRGTS